MVLEDNSWPSLFLKEMYELLQNDELVDVHLKTTDGKRISAHRSVLAASSPYFRGMFSGCFTESSLNEILLNGITGDALRQIVDFCYTGKIDVSADNVEDILIAANLFQMTRLQETCEGEYVKSLHSENCFVVHNCADTHNLQSVLKTSQQFILKHFPEVCKQPEFTDLTNKQLFRLLESDDLIVWSEEDAFNALMRWVNVHLIEREKLLPELLPLIRLEQLSSEFLHKHVNEVALKANCARLLLDANTWNQLPNLRSEISLRHSGRLRNRHINKWLVAFSGSSGNEVTLEWYSPEKNEWTIWRSGTQLNDSCAQKTGKVWSLDLNNLSFTQLESLNIPRSGFCAQELNGHVYVIGGTCHLQIGVSDSVEKFDPVRNTWTFIAPMKYGRNKAAATTFNGMLYVFSGCGWPIWAEGEYYNPTTNKWTLTASMRYREQACAVSLNDSIYIIGGEIVENGRRYKYDLVQRYVPLKDKWSSENIAPLISRNGAGVVEMSKKIVFAGGLNKNYARCKKMVNQYDYEKNIWTEIANMREGSTNVSLFIVRNVNIPTVLLNANRRQPCGAINV